MSLNRLLPVLASLALVVIAPFSMGAQTASTHPATAPDAGLYTNYYGTLTSVNWIVCGSTSESEGCYGFGTLGPFVGVGAMLESNPSYSGDIVTRYIYVVDTGASPVSLYIYKKTDTISASYDTTLITLARVVSLSQLVGGESATTYMAANADYLFIGTSLSPNAVSVSKTTAKVTELGGFSPPTDVTSITSDEYGYVTVTQGTAFTVFGPDGSETEDGGGTQFMLGTTQAVSASSLLIGDFAPVHVRMKPKTHSNTLH